MGSKKLPSQRRGARKARRRLDLMKGHLATLLDLPSSSDVDEMIQECRLSIEQVEADLALGDRQWVRMQAEKASRTALRPPGARKKKTIGILKKVGKVGLNTLVQAAVPGLVGQLVRGVSLSEALPQAGIAVGDHVAARASNWRVGG